MASAVPRRVAHEAPAVRSDLAAPELAEDQEAASAGLVRGLPWWRNARLIVQFPSGISARAGTGGAVERILLQMPQKPINAGVFSGRHTAEC